MGQRDILAVKTLDVTHHLGLGVVAVEDLVGEVAAGTSLCNRSGLCGQGGYLFAILAYGNGEDAQQHVHGSQVCGLVDAQTHVAILEVVEVDLFTQGDGADLLG